MSLFVRVEVSFWTHRKTIRLRSLLGDSALWLPLRLWSYAAQNQSDGDFTDYSPEELAMLLGYTSNAQSMLQALQRAGFMDGMLIHGWGDYNGYHAAFSERAKKAATARWEKERSKEKPEKTGEEKRGEEASIPSSNAPSMREHTSPDHPAGWAPPMELFVAECAKYHIPRWFAEKKWKVFDAKEWKIGQTPANWKKMIRLVSEDFINDGSPESAPPPGSRNGSPRQTEAQRDQANTGLPRQEIRLKRL